MDEDKQDQFVEWLRDQLQTGNFAPGSQVVDVEENGRGGVDGLLVTFDDGDVIEISIAAGEPE